MLSDSNRLFMSDTMMFDVDLIDRRLNDHRCIHFKDELELAISKFIEAISLHGVSGSVCDLSSHKGGEAELLINNYSADLLSGLTDEFTLATLDSLRHAFFSFAYNGLHQLYTRQENEAWYPRIILTRILEPNDINMLEDRFFIYRGCDKAELESGNFGQSWSTCKFAASEFAFNHYDSQDWYNVANRVILQTNYSRANVLFSDQTEFGEYEIAVETEFLSGVTVCT